jgi:copper(I)-binding protein
MVLVTAFAVRAAEPDGLSVENARVRWLPGDRPMAGYLVLENDGNSARTLTGARSGAFARIMMHRSEEEDGQARMEHVGQIVVAPGSAVTFEPGGLHLMLMKRQRELQPGDTVQIELRFDDDAVLPVRFRIGGIDEG